MLSCYYALGIRTTCHSLV